MVAGSATPNLMFELRTCRRGPGPGFGPPNARGTSTASNAIAVATAMPVVHHRRARIVAGINRSDSSPTYGVNAMSVSRYHVRSSPNSRMIAKVAKATANPQQAVPVPIRHPRRMRDSVATGCSLAAGSSAAGVVRAACRGPLPLLSGGVTPPVSRNTALPSAGRPGTALISIGVPYPVPLCERRDSRQNVRSPPFGGDGIRGRRGRQSWPRLAFTEILLRMWA
jgi:hypothetical protein